MYCHLVEIKRRGGPFILLTAYREYFLALELKRNLKIVFSQQQGDLRYTGQNLWRGLQLHLLGTPKKRHWILVEENIKVYAKVIKQKNWYLHLGIGKSFF